MYSPYARTDFVSSLSELQQIVELLRQRGVSDDHLKRLLTQLHLTDAVAALLTQDPGSLTTCRFVVPYDQPLDQLLHAANLNGRHRDITSDNFPHEPGEPKIVDAELVDVTDLVVRSGRQAVTTQQGLAKLADLGLRPATLTELLSFAIAYPEAQLHFDVIALGSAFVAPVSVRVEENPPQHFNWPHFPYLGHGEYYNPTPYRGEGPWVSINRLSADGGRWDSWGQDPKFVRSLGIRKL